MYVFEFFRIRSVLLKKMVNFCNTVLQDYITMVIMDSGIRLINKHSSISLALTRTARHLKNKVKLLRRLMVPIIEKLLYLHQLLQ